MVYTSLFDATITSAELTFLFRFALMITLFVLLRGRKHLPENLTAIVFTVTAYFFAVGRYDLSTVSANLATVLLFYVLLTRKGS